MTSTTKEEMLAAGQTWTWKVRLRAEVVAGAFAILSVLATGVARRTQAQTFVVLHSFPNWGGDGASPRDV